MLLRGESEQLLLARRVHQLNVGHRHARVVMQIGLVYSPGCPRLLLDLWGVQRCEMNRAITLVSELSAASRECSVVADRLNSVSAVAEIQFSLLARSAALI